MRISARISADRTKSALSDYFRFANQRFENAALIATHRAGVALKDNIRTEMATAGLGRLGFAFTSKSDLDRGGIQKRLAGEGFSAGSIVYVRSGSERTRGAIKAYTEGANIAPVHGRWLWIPTEEIQRRVGPGRRKFRVTPGNWEEYGLQSKIGPLVYVKSINGNPLLVVKDASVGALGQSRSAKSRTKTGKLRKGQAAKSFIVAFIGIPRTARAARVDLNALHREAIATLPARFFEALGRI